MPEESKINTMHEIIERNIEQTIVMVELEVSIETTES